jgi:hypothetical protein
MNDQLPAPGRFTAAPVNYEAGCVQSTTGGFGGDDSLKTKEDYSAFGWSALEFSTYRHRFIVPKETFLCLLPITITSEYFPGTAEYKTNIGKCMTQNAGLFELHVGPTGI